MGAGVQSRGCVWTMSTRAELLSTLCKIHYHAWWHHTYLALAKVSHFGYVSMYYIMGGPMLSSANFLKVVMPLSLRAYSQWRTCSIQDCYCCSFHTMKSLPVLDQHGHCHKLSCHTMSPRQSNISSHARLRVLQKAYNTQAVYITLGLMFLPISFGAK